MTIDEAKLTIGVLLDHLSARDACRALFFMAGKLMEKQRASHLEVRDDGPFLSMANNEMIVIVAQGMSAGGLRHVAGVMANQIPGSARVIIQEHGE
jgi:hypothetical protein